MRVRLRFRDRIAPEVLDLMARERWAVAFGKFNSKRVVKCRRCLTPQLKYRARKVFFHRHFFGYWCYHCRGTVL